MPGEPIGNMVSTFLQIIVGANWGAERPRFAAVQDLRGPAAEPRDAVCSGPKTRALHEGPPCLFLDFLSHSVTDGSSRP